MSTIIEIQRARAVAEGQAVTEREELEMRLYSLKEKVCATEGCNHSSARGYILCNHCLHGGCSRAPQGLIQEIYELEKRLAQPWEESSTLDPHAGCCYHVGQQIMPLKDCCR